MATIKDVAALAGVALGTASRVLSGSSQTSQSSRARVLAAAEELEYVANGPARSLRRSKTDVLGLVVSDIRNQFFSELAHAAEQEAGRLGYTVLLANADEDQALVDEYLRTFASQRIDGLLLAPQAGGSEHLAAVQATGLPIVLLNRTVAGVEAPMIGSDNVAGVASVLSWLRDHGHRDVAFVGGPPSISTAAERLHGFLAGREAYGISASPDLLEAGDFRVQGGAAATGRILDRGVSFTAIVGANGPTSVGAVTELRRRLGVAGAAAIDVVSFDDLDWFELASPPISAVRNHADVIGRVAVQSVVDLIEGRQVASQRIPTSFVDRSVVLS
jgi:LacI family transcriptional regulator